jgi:hypothetical protein
VTEVTCEPPEPTPAPITCEPPPPAPVTCEPPPPPPPPPPPQHHDVVEHYDMTTHHVNVDHHIIVEHNEVVSHRDVVEHHNDVQYAIVSHEKSKSPQQSRSPSPKNEERPRSPWYRNSPPRPCKLFVDNHDEYLGNGHHILNDSTYHQSRSISPVHHVSPCEKSSSPCIVMGHYENVIEHPKRQASPHVHVVVEHHDTVSEHHTGPPSPLNFDRPASPYYIDGEHEVTMTRYHHRDGGESATLLQSYGDASSTHSTLVLTRQYHWATFFQ